MVTNHVIGLHQWWEMRDHLSHMHLPHDVLSQQNVDKITVTAKSFLAGGLAGATSKSLTAPLERVKMLMQTSSPVYRGMGGLAIVTHVVKTDGFTALWRGNMANVIRILPNRGLLYMLHDMLISGLTEKGQELSDTRRLLAGSLSGTLMVTCSYPLDLLQTRLTTSSKGQYRGMWHCFTDAYQTGGVRGLYKGYAITVLGVTPYLGLQFFVYEKLKIDVRAHYKKRNKQVGAVEKLLCGATAGIVAQTVTFPLDTLKRRIQTADVISGGHKYTGMVDCLIRIIRHEGVIKGLFRGAGVNVLKAGPSQAVQYLAYEFLKEKLGVPKLQGE